MFRRTSFRLLSLIFILIGFLLLDSNTIFAQSEKDNGDGTVAMLQIDTVTVFDPTSLKETVNVVKTEVTAYTNPQFMPVFRPCKTASPEDRNNCTKEKLASYLDSNLIYPLELRENRIDGTVMVKFVVTDDGMVSMVSIDKGVNPYLDQEALKAIYFLNRVFEESPFYPGKTNGEPVNVKMTVPVKFSASTK